MLDRGYIQEKLGNAAMLMSNRTPALLGFYIMLEKRIVSDKMITMRVGYTDGHPYLEASDWFINALEPTLLGAVVYMNCLRISLHHCDIRVKMPEQLFKLASDIVVCEYARTLVNTDSGDNAHIIAQLFPSIWSYSDKFGNKNFDPATDLTLEKVFDLLVDSQQSNDGDNTDDNDTEPNDENDNGSNSSDDSGDGGGSSDSDESNSTDSDNNESDTEDSEQDKSDGQSDGQSSENSNGDSSETDPDESEDNDQGQNGGNSTSESYKAVQQMFEPQNASTDMQDWGESEEFEDEIRATAAAAFANGNLGAAAGRVPLIIKEANKVKIDAASIFTMFMESNFSSNFRPTWSMPNLALRRFGTIAPGHVRKKDKPAILFGIDVSGSMMAMNLIELCIQTVDRFLGDTKMDLCYWDAKCSEILHNPKDAYTTDLYGGGGTNPQCVLDEIERQHLHYDGVVLLTDCDFDWEMPPNPGLICIIRTPKSSSQFPIWCQWKMEFDDVVK